MGNYYRDRREVENNWTGYLRDGLGRPIADIGFKKDDKIFAVIVKGGHCGTGYYIPFIVTVKCKDKDTAITFARSIPRAKHEQTYSIIDAFEITQFESYCIKIVNDYDKYLKGYLQENSEEIRERRIAMKQGDVYTRLSKEARQQRECVEIRTADEYDSKYVLERFCAPRTVGSELVYPRRINKEELMKELITQNTCRQGIKRGRQIFLSLYYQMFGKNNDLGIVYDKSGYFYYTDEEGKKRTCVISPELKHVLDDWDKPDGIYKKKTQEVVELSENDKPKQSSIDRFNARFARTKEIQNKMKELGAKKAVDSELVEIEPGE